MKKFFLLLFFASTYLNSFSQCPNDNALTFAAPQNLTPSSVGTTTANTQVWAGEYVTVNVVNGGNYTFKTCVGNTYNTALTIYRETGGSLLKGFNDDFCSTQSQISWTADFTGVLRVLLDEMPGCSSNATNSRIDVTLNSLPCVTPTLSVTSFSNVTCFGGNNGSATVSASGGSSFTYTWSPSGGSAAIASGLSTGVYTCSTTNNCGATASQTVQISQPTAIIGTTAVTHPLCNGNNGSATITASGGAAPYTYTWSSGPTASIEPTLLAGTYTVRVTDASACNITRTVTITQPSALVTSSAVNNVLCFGNSTGAATVIASGGTPGYIYLWSTAATTSVITGLNAGVRTVTVTDANNCTTTRTITISQSASALNTSTAVTNVLCFGNSTGAATVTASGGTSPYTYLWSGAQTTSVISGQIAGVKTVTITDANGCTSTGTVNINQPGSGITTSTAVTNVLCFGNSTGAATVNASGGTSPYTYLWSGAQTTSVISGQIAGVKTVTITDANGCTSTSAVNINQSGSGITTSTAVTNVLCFGNSTGAATVTASGGTSPYTYLWSGAQTTSVISGQIAGVKTVTITDANGCTSTSTVNINQSGSGITTSTAVTNVLCFGNSTGAATVTASGGTSPYTYLWSGAQTTSVISGQIAGVKTVTITDANGCTSTSAVNINQPGSGITTSTAVTNVLCFGNSTGAATVTASGGTTPYTYLWSGAQTTSVISGQIAGVRTVTITDASGCNSTNTITITQPSANTASVNISSQVSCFGGNNGVLTSTGLSGQAPYSFLWSPGTCTTATYTAATAGTYTLLVTDANNCTATATGTITQPSAILTNTAVANILCFGNSTGAATLTASGGTSPYTYLWSGAQTTSVISGQLAGVRTVTVTDANSCTVVATANVTQPASALASATAVTNVLCFGNATGSATLTASGGTSPYTYLWSGAQTTSVISGQTSGVKTVTITDANGCTSTGGVNINQPGSGITTNTAVTNVLCFGTSTGAATVTASGGTSPYTYLWSGAQTTSVISGQIAGVKTVTITDANGCTSTSAVNINQPGSGITTSTAVTNVLCFGNSTGAATVTASGGTTPYTYLWSGAQTTSVISGQIAGVRTVTITDASGCNSTNTITITQPSANTASVNISSQVSCFGGNNGVLTSTGLSGQAPYSFLWSPGTRTTATYTAATAGTYTLLVTDANNCTATATGTITQPSAILTNTAVANILCFGNSTGAATLTASGGTSPYTYLWSGAQTTSVISGQLAGVRTVTVTDANSCTVVATANVTQPASALASATAVTNVLCFGNATGSATLTASGGTSPYTYLWSGAQTTSVISGQTSGVKTVTITDANGCTTNNSITLSQPTALTLTAVASNPTICVGNSSSLTASGSGGTGAITYTWVSGPTNSIYVVSPTVNTTYTINASDANACSLSGTVSINANALPTISINSGSICAGQNFTLVPNGASSYTISGGSSVVSPITTTNYTITGSTAGCVSSNTVISTVTVNPLPAIAALSQTICSGSTTTLIASGANTYTWSTGANTNSIVVTPATTTVYTVNGTSAFGCVGSAAVSATITLGSAPSIAVNSSTICSGGSATLIASGVNTYTWSTGANTNSIVVTPAINTVYTVNGILQGCALTATNTSTVTVNSSPTVSVNSGAICLGQSFTIIPSGATTYTISGGSLLVTPTTNTGYTLVGTSSLGCISSNTAVSSVTVNALPIISIPSATICVGSTGTLTASGANTYTWSTGSNATSIFVSPLTTTTYTANGTSPDGCIGNSVTATLTVGPAPSIIVNSATVCSGSNATLSANGVTTYTWNTGSNSSSIVVTPNSNTTYSVSGNLTGCNVTANNTSSVTVNVLPVIIAASNESLLCEGTSASLTVSGATTYSWSTGSTSTLEVVSPTLTTTYTITGIGANGCSNFTSITQSVSPCTDISLNTVREKNHIMHFPNPNKGNFIIELKNGLPKTIHLMDITGRVLISKNTNEDTIEFNISYLENGIYYIRITSEGFDETIKNVKE